MSSDVGTNLGEHNIPRRLMGLSLAHCLSRSGLASNMAAVIAVLV
jgi:hypothetical protein